MGSSPTSCTTLSGCSSVGRTGGLGPSGREFESRYPDQMLRCDNGSRAVLKTVVLKGIGGSSPSLSAKISRNFMLG